MKIKLNIEESKYSLDLQDAVMTHESAQQTVWNFKSPVEGQSHIISGLVLPKFCGLYFLVLRKSNNQKILFPSLWLREYVERYFRKKNYVLSTSIC